MVGWLVGVRARSMIYFLDIGFVCILNPKNGVLGRNMDSVGEQRNELETHFIHASFPHPDAKYTYI